MSNIEELSVQECWALLRAQELGRLAVVVGDHPEIFPINYTVDQGTVVFRSARGTKVFAALSDSPVALEIDGYDEPTNRAWSVVVKGQAKYIKGIEELLDTFNMDLTPWQEGTKDWFIRIVPTEVTGRRFPKADPKIWQTPQI